LIETNPSIIQTICFKDKQYFLKRDDLLDGHFSGNKARKFYYYLYHDFPHTMHLVSHGSPQSNAMYSLSVLAQRKGWTFTYYVSHIASFLKENPHGNYAHALNNGMKIIEGVHPLDYHDNTLFIPEGGHIKEAQIGIKQLADEINDVYHDKQIDIFLPSGTGTTALFLQKYTDFRVYTTPCVGNSGYLKQQFFALEKEEVYHPQILNMQKKYHFGKLYREFFEIWIELKEQTGVEFDLLYDPKGWLTLLAHQSQFQNDILYIHQGGLLGNESMLKRYGRKFHEDTK
jgi:1-aminocyclopropane-1-carboxylate deaminase/D-cysteine desulfhydrase-like pyridoxal-dependent ACC family enzyme